MIESTSAALHLDRVLSESELTLEAIALSVWLVTTPGESVLAEQLYGLVLTVSRCEGGIEDDDKALLLQLVCRFWLMSVVIIAERTVEIHQLLPQESVAGSQIFYRVFLLIERTEDVEQVVGDALVADD